MENYLVEAFNEMNETKYPDLESIKKPMEKWRYFGVFLNTRESMVIPVRFSKRLI